MGSGGDPVMVSQKASGQLKFSRGDSTDDGFAVAPQMTVEHNTCAPGTSKVRLQHSTSFSAVGGYRLSIHSATAVAGRRRPGNGWGT